MTEYELAQRIKVEWAELQANMPQMYVSPEAQEILDRVRDYFSEKRGEDNAKRSSNSRTMRLRA